MSFHFKKLHLKNWLVYGGEHEVAFPDLREGQNLVVFDGQNGFGKTSLLRGLEFVFHGRSRTGLIDFWHEKARDNGSGKLEIALDFTHRNRLCKLVRGATFGARGNSFTTAPYVRLWIDGEEQTDQIEDKIEQILPKQCQQFTFFDGAEITRYAQKQHEEGVRDAIERVLGIPAVRNLRDDLVKVIGQLEDEQADVMGAEEQSQTLLAEIDDLRGQEASCMERRQALLDGKRSIERTLQELEREAAEVEAIEAEREQLAEKQSRRADFEEKRKEIDGQIAELLRQAPLYLLLPALNQLTEELAAKQTTPARDAKLQAKKAVLEELVEEAKCVCGREIDDEIEAVLRRELSKIDSLLSRRPPLPRSSDQRELLDLISIVRQLRSAPPAGTELIDARASVDVRLEEVEKDISDLKERLAGHESVQVKELFQQMRELERNRSEINTDLQATEANLSRVASDLLEKQREFDRLAVGTERGAPLTRTLDKARRAHRAVTWLVESMVARKREQIEQLATQMFRRITNKPQEYAGVRVKDDYTVEVHRHDGTTVESAKLSAGEKEVVAYSFITARNLASAAPAPFVMDTPFGHLDSEHREGLLKSLPELKVQAFLLATDRDLPEGERDKVNEHIAAEYVIRRDQRGARSYFEEA